LIQPNHIIVMPFRLVETMSNHQTIRNSVAADTQPSTSLVQTTPSNYKSYQRSWQDLWQSYIAAQTPNPCPMGQYHVHV
jgi:hypothetical protein